MPAITPTNPNVLVQGQLTERLKCLEEQMLADALFFCGPIEFGVDDIIREALEEVNPKKNKLCFILETNGGLIEVVQRIADTMRTHYAVVDFVIPNHAYSAGTVLVMSGDEIYMDDYSVLGPIDPQLQRGGRMIPAVGYLEQYNRLIKKSARGNLTTAEMAFLINKFDPAELYQYEQARNLSISLLKDWLVRYKFKNWNRTETRKHRVSHAMKVQRAARIARDLNNVELWNSHGRGISRRVLQDKLNLKIVDFGASANLNKCIREYYRLLKNYMLTTGHHNLIHTHKQFSLITATSR